jgi:ribosomal protein S18 acetylase RimI-like enzyme
MTTTLAELPVAPAGSGLAFRRFTGLEEIPGMAAANLRLRTHVGHLEPIDVEGMRHRYTHLVNSDPLRDCLVVTLDDVTAGYTRAEWSDLSDGDRLYDLTLIVEPEAWGRGATDRLLDWGERRFRELVAEHPTDRRSWFANYAFNGDTELEHALTAHGYEAVRWDAEMLRPDLEDIRDVELPPGYTVRSPREDELGAVWAMAVEAFHEHWGQGEEDEQLIGDWVDDPRFRLDLNVVAFRGDEPAAFVWNVLETAPDGTPRGLLNGVCTSVRHRRLGLAKATIAESLRRLKATGAASAYLGVDTDNHNRAFELYEWCGFRRVTGGTSWRKPAPQEVSP